MKGCVAQEGIEPSTPTLARSSLTANIERTSARRASCPHWRPLPLKYSQRLGESVPGEPNQSGVRVALVDLGRGDIVAGAREMDVDDACARVEAADNDFAVVGSHEDALDRVAADVVRRHRDVRAGPEPGRIAALWEIDCRGRGLAGNIQRRRAENLLGIAVPQRPDAFDPGKQW